MSIHQQAVIPAAPDRVYAVLADASALSALSGKTGRPAAAGEEFSAFDGNVTGRQVELVPGTRIVQAWRFPVWAPGVYRQPALAVYTRDEANGLWRASGLLVLTVRGDQITGLTRFESATLRSFDLPRILPVD